ncbi:MAG: plasmid mobilization relaxosome protein MobC [Steroidobacteraceae bacterium]
MATGHTHLRTWVSAETKQRFEALAHELGLSEAALLKRSVNLMLSSTTVALPDGDGSPKAPRGLRVSVRLRVEDHALLRERATARDIPAATYVSMVLRAYLRSLAPLPDRELTELRRAVGELSVIGRNLNQIARVANQSGRIGGPTPVELRAILRALEGLRDHVKALMLANAKSWESGRG